MRLIDAEALKRDLEISPYNDYDDYLRTERLIDDAPTVDTTFREVVAYECGQKSVAKKQCGACSHLIFKDHKHHEGRCSISGWDMHFEDICSYYEYIDNPENLHKVTRRLNHGTTTEC